MKCDRGFTMIKVYVPPNLSSPNSLIIMSTFSYFCLRLMLPGSLKHAANTKVSSTVNCGQRISSCVTKPILEEKLCNMKLTKELFQ